MDAHDDDTNGLGHVEVGGPPEVRRAGSLEITKLAVGPMANNAYLLRDVETDALVLIDAAAEPDRLLELVGDRPLDGIVTTHRHPDHTGALAALVASTGAPVLAGDADADALPVAVDGRLAHGDLVEVGSTRLEVIALRGHTPGSIALLHDADGEAPQLFTGDSLFPGGVGKTADPADFASLIDDVETRVFDRLPAGTRVAPGHGDDTTLGAERPHLGEWRTRGW